MEAGEDYIFSDEKRDYDYNLDMKCPRCYNQVYVCTSKHKGYEFIHEDVRCPECGTIMDVYHYG